MSDPLEIKNLNKKYGAVSAVDQVNLSLKKGEIFALLGPNGAGKTSIISMITTLEKPSSGEILVFGNDVTKNPRLTKNKLGVVHQEVINSGFFDVEEILEFQSGYYGIRKNKERIDFLLHKLGLFDHKKKKVKQLSGGMKRRLMIAKALVHNPEILLLDEPTAGVDINLRESLWKFVQELQKSGMTILLTTHYLEEAEQLCERVGIINHGRIEIVDETKKIIEKFSGKIIEVVLSAPLGPGFSPLASNIDVSGSPHSTLQGASTKFVYNFEIPQSMTLGEVIGQNGIPPENILDLKIIEGSLEQGFLKILKEKGKTAGVVDKTQ